MIIIIIIRRKTSLTMRTYQSTWVVNREHTKVMLKVFCNLQLFVFDTFNLLSNDRCVKTPLGKRILGHIVNVDIFAPLYFRTSDHRGVFGVITFSCTR